MPRQTPRIGARRIEDRLVEDLDEPKLVESARGPVEGADPGQDELVGFADDRPDQPCVSLSAPSLRSMFWTEPRLPIPWSTMTIILIGS